MKYEDLLNRITVEPEICGGKPCIRSSYTDPPFGKNIVGCIQPDIEDTSYDLETVL